MSGTYRDGRHRTRDGLELYYRDYSDPGAGKRPALCIPGLTRNSRDFADLASHLARDRRVICVELRGRGRSDYDTNPEGYAPPTYLQDLVDLIEAEGLAPLVAVGTSLGGMLTMMLAAARPGTLAAAVLNDIGPEVDPRGIERIRGYVGKGAVVGSWEEAAASLREINSSVFPDFGPDDWLKMAHCTYAVGEDGLLRPDYDPRIAERFVPQGDAESNPVPALPDLWPFFGALRTVPTLVVRGEISDILSRPVLERMAALHPEFDHVEVPGRGHAPLLTEPACLAAIERVLARADGAGSPSP